MIQLNNSGVNIIHFLKNFKFISIIKIKNKKIKKTTNKTKKLKILLNFSRYGLVFFYYYYCFTSIFSQYKLDKIFFFLTKKSDMRVQMLCIIDY